MTKGNSALRSNFSRQDRRPLTAYPAWRSEQPAASPFGPWLLALVADVFLPLFDPATHYCFAISLLGDGFGRLNRFHHLPGLYGCNLRHFELRKNCESCGSSNSNFRCQRNDLAFEVGFALQDEWCSGSESDRIAGTRIYILAYRYNEARRLRLKNPSFQAVATRVE
jgi:hypothetical protein